MADQIASYSSQIWDKISYIFVYCYWDIKPAFAFSCWLWATMNVLLFQGRFQPCSEEHVRVLVLTQQPLQAREPLTPQKQGEYYVSWDQQKETL